MENEVKSEMAPVDVAETEETNASEIVAEASQQECGQQEAKQEEPKPERGGTIADGAVDAGTEAEQECVENSREGGDEPRDDARVAALVAEAEHRGYLRGRNERIEQLMAQPGVWETPKQQPPILSRMRRSVWDD